MKSLSCRSSVVNTTGIENFWTGDISKVPNGALQEKEACDAFEKQKQTLIITLFNITLDFLQYCRRSSGLCNQKDKGVFSSAHESSIRLASFSHHVPFGLARILNLSATRETQRQDGFDCGMHGYQFNRLHEF
ncbi:hypothetical protein SUGI_0061720 [Cryptomeria japonica]|nr:hypothetical protein SUGI_0061720 [Cryptomeria japonica]